MFLPQALQLSQAGLDFFQARRIDVRTIPVLLQFPGGLLNFDVRCAQRLHNHREGLIDLCGGSHAFDDRPQELGHRSVRCVQALVPETRRSPKLFGGTEHLPLG